MNVKLIRPDNGQHSDFREYRDGMIALDTTCVTSAMRWFTMQAVQVCNPTAYLLAAFDSGLLYTVPEPDQRTMDNVMAFTEVMNSRNPERQASRDLYTYQLYCEIADEVAA